MRRSKDWMTLWKCCRPRTVEFNLWCCMLSRLKQIINCRTRLALKSFRFWNWTIEKTWRMLTLLIVIHLSGLAPTIKQLFDNVGVDWCLTYFIEQFWMLSYLVADVRLQRAKDPSVAKGPRHQYAHCLSSCIERNCVHCLSLLYQIDTGKVYIYYSPSSWKESLWWNGKKLLSKRDVWIIHRCIIPCSLSHSLWTSVTNLDFLSLPKLPSTSTF